MLSAHSQMPPLLFQEAQRKFILSAQWKKALQVQSRNSELAGLRRSRRYAARRIRLRQLTYPDQRTGSKWVDVIIQRTGAGTQGIVRSVNANTLLAASLVVANATVTAHPQTLARNCHFRDHRSNGGMEAGMKTLPAQNILRLLLKGQQPDSVPYIDRVYKSRDALLHLDPNLPAFPRSDLDHCTNIDAFDFAMPVTKRKRTTCHARHQTLTLEYPCINLA